MSEVVVRNPLDVPDGSLLSSWVMASLEDVLLCHIRDTQSPKCILQKASRRKVLACCPPTAGLWSERDLSGSRRDRECPSLMRRNSPAEKDLCLFYPRSRCKVSDLLAKPVSDGYDRSGKRSSREGPIYVLRPLTPDLTSDARTALSLRGEESAHCSSGCRQKKTHV